jgi:enterochelin esterase-like enzyme
VGLLGWPLLALMLTLAVAFPVACVLLWVRVHGLFALPARVSLVVASQVAAVLAVGVVVNDKYQFFASWSDLIGGQNGTNTPIEQPNYGGPPMAAGPLRNDFRAGPDHTLEATVHGTASRIRSKIWVWLPPQYRTQPQRRFPVVELFSGYPGTPETWFHAMQGPKKLQQAMNTGAAQPYILVAPTITVQPGHDTECVNVPHGPKVATWLTADVRRIITSNFRTLPGTDSWGTMGYSTGGFCAAKLPVQYPKLFRAGVSIAGYFSPFTSALARLPGENVPALIRKRHPHVDLLLAASKQDPGTVGSVATMVKVARPPTLVYTYVVPRGGHNTGVWAAMLPKCFQWLTTELAHRH